MGRVKGVRRLMPARTEVAILAALVVGCLGAEPATTVASPGGVSATVAADTADIANDRVTRHWAYGATGLTTTSLADVSTGHSWSTSSSNDFTITVNAISTDSTAWSVTAASAGPVPADPSRPLNTGGEQVSFTLQP